VLLYFKIKGAAIAENGGTFLFHDGPNPGKASRVQLNFKLKSCNVKL
jgi:hypothetical protein